MRKVRGENGRMPKKVYFTDKRQNRWLVKQLKKRSPLHEVEFSLVTKRKQLVEIPDRKVILIWGSGMEHDRSFFIDIPGERKRNVDAHHDCSWTIDDTVCVHGANHMAHSAVKHGVKVELTMPGVAGDNDPVYYGIINKQKLLEETGKPIDIVPISVPFGGEHTTIDLDCVEFFPADPGFISGNGIGFSLMNIVDFLGHTIDAGNLRRLDVGGLSEYICTKLEVNGKPLPDNVLDVPKKSIFGFAEGKLDKYSLRIAGFAVRVYYDILKKAIFG